MRRISDRALTRNEARACEFSGLTYGIYDGDRFARRLDHAHRVITDERPLTDRVSRWEPSIITIRAAARRLSKHGAPLGGTKAHRRMLRTRAVQRARRQAARFEAEGCPF
jgi:hypothetical protein